MTDIEKRLQVIERLLLIEFPENCDPTTCNKWKNLRDSTVKGCADDSSCPLIDNRISIMSSYMQQIGALVQEHQRLVELLIQEKAIPSDSVERVRKQLLLKALQERKEELVDRLRVFQSVNVPDDIVQPLQGMLAETEKQIAALETK